MTYDILCHKSGKLWCFNGLRIQTLPIILRIVILRIVGFVEKMKLQRSKWRMKIANSLTGGGQTKVQRWSNKVDLRAEWPLQGIQSEKVASGRCSPISTNNVALFGLSCTRLGLVSTLHLALAIFQQGAPCFGHRPKMNPNRRVHEDNQQFSTIYIALHVLSPWLGSVPNR